jgi:DNA-binding transcriptional MerR regulator
MVEEEKLFYTIGEVAQIVEVKPYVLRYWETEFRKLNPQKSVTGQRAYRNRDIRVALTIKRLLYVEKYTIAGAVKKLEELDEKNALDQIEMFSTATSSKGASKRVETLNSTSPDKEGTLPSISREKVREIKSLIISTKAILRRYGL